MALKKTMNKKKETEEEKILTQKRLDRLVKRMEEVHKSTPPRDTLRPVPRESDALRPVRRESKDSHSDFSSFQWYFKREHNYSK